MEKGFSGLFLTAFAFFVGILTSGAVADWFVRRGVSVLTVMFGFIFVYLAAQAGIAACVTHPVAMPALWFLFGMCGQVAVLAYPWLSHHFGVELSGRAHTAINLILFASAFVLQYAIGAGIGQFVPRATGGYDTHAYQVVFGAVLILQLVALAWYGLNRSAILRSPASS